MTKPFALLIVRVAVVLNTLVGAFFALAILCFLWAMLGSKSVAGWLLAVFAIPTVLIAGFLLWSALKDIRSVWRGENGGTTQRVLFGSILMLAWALAYPVLAGCESSLEHFGMSVETMHLGETAAQRLSPFVYIGLRVIYWWGAYRLYLHLKNSVLDTLLPDALTVARREGLIR
jgi:hypothetical protein